MASGGAEVCFDFFLICTQFLVTAPTDIHSKSTQKLSATFLNDSFYKAATTFKKQCMPGILHNCTDARSDSL